MQLRRSTVLQASTLTELQYQQVLDNIAMFTCDPEALPWHLKIKGGTVQVTDLGAGAISGAFGNGDATNSVFPNFNVQRTRLGQWDVEPAVDSDELEMLQLAYRKAIQPLSEDVDEDIRFQIWTLVVAYQFTPNSDTLLDIVKDAVKRWTEDLQKKVVDATLDPNFAQTDVCRFHDLMRRLDEVNQAFRELIDTQLAQKFPKDTSEDYQHSNHDLLTFVKNLDTRPLFRCQPFESEEQIAYAMEFDCRINSVICALQAAHDEFANLDQTTKNVKKIREVMEWITYMNNEIELRRTIQRLNPGRKQQIVVAKKASRNPVVDQLFAVSDPDLTDGGVHSDIMKFFGLAGSWKYFISQTSAKLQPRNPGLSDQAQTKVDKLIELVDEGSSLKTPWFFTGRKRDVPCDACFVGHYKGCGNDLYVWVMPEGLKTLREFSLIIQSLTAIEKQDSFTGRGVSYSPGLH